jgi:uncharacterized membrane protein
MKPMITEFHQLTEKVKQIATLVQTVRAENADLRRQIADLTRTNADLTGRIQQAHERVSDVLGQAPFNMETQ